MRPSPRHRLTGLAIALTLLSALTLYSATGASAALLGEVLPKVTVKAPGLLTVESAPTPRVEVPGVATVEVPTPRVEVPALPPVTTPSLPPVTSPSTPPVTVPSAGTPVGQTPSLPGASGGSSTSPSSGTSAHDAATSASSTSAGSSQAGASGAQPAASRVSGKRSSRSGVSKRRRASSTRAGRALASGSGASTNAGSTPIAASPAARKARSNARKSSSDDSSGNPLAEIGRQIPFPVPVPDWSKPIILLLLLLAIWFAVRSRLAALRARRLERQRAVLLGDLDAMQAALVPVIPSRLGDVSVSVAYRPADGPAAGGDFYDLFALAPGKVAIVLGDVAGHGPSALNQAALTRYTLRAYMQAGLEPRAALSLAGSVLAEPAEMQFATVLVAVYDTAAGRLTYASGGHDPPISIGFDTPEPPSVCCSAPVGCALPTGRRQTTLSVPPGGAVCFFSDGLLEARTADGLLGRERLSELVGELGPRTSAAALLERVRDEASRTPDDMVACIVSSAVGAPAATAQVEELEVDRNALAAANVPIFLRACGVPAAGVAPLLARARELVADGATALLRIERPAAGESSAAALRGLAPAASQEAIAQARAAEGQLLELPLGRASA